MPEKPAAQVEVDGDETVTIEYTTRHKSKEPGPSATYTFPSALDNCSARVIRAIDDGKMSYALEHLLGKEQYDRFDATDPVVYDYNDLFGAYAEKIGLQTTGN